LPKVAFQKREEKKRMQRKRVEMEVVLGTGGRWANFGQPGVCFSLE
jgi:hypothetical protein